MKFYLVGGQIKFLTHKVEYTQRNEQKEMSFYDVEKKDALLARLVEREITPTVTEYEQPSAELLAKCEGKTFNTYEGRISICRNRHNAKDRTANTSRNSRCFSISIIGGVVMYETLKRLYQSGKATQQHLVVAVTKGFITEVQRLEIIG